MAAEYYIAVKGQPKGPMTIEELVNQGLTPESLVWKPGLQNWVKATELEELKFALNLPPVIEEAIQNEVPPVVEIDEEPIWFAMINGKRRVGPLTPKGLLAEGLTPDTPVWTGGMSDWQPARTRRELDHLFYRSQTPPDSFQSAPGSDNRFANNPQYNPGHQYDHQRGTYTGYNSYHDNNNPYRDNNYRPAFRTNWLPWAIGATVVGFIFSCIGAIFGIIGIVNANQANNLYARGDNMEGDRVNGNAKTMTIIGYIFAGIGILFLMFFGGIRGFYSY